MHDMTIRQNDMAVFQLLADRNKSELGKLKANMNGQLKALRNTEARSTMELNEAIEERRQIVINEQKELKKKYEPDAYDKILAESGE